MMKTKVSSAWLWPGTVMLIIGATGIYYEIRDSIALGELTVPVWMWLLSPFLIPGIYFVMLGLGKALPHPKWFWTGLILLYLGLLLLLEMTVFMDVLAGVIVSAPFLGIGGFCAVRGTRKPNDLSQLPP